MERAAVSLLAVQDIPSIPALLAARAEATPDGEALRSPAARGWASMTWSQVATSVRRAAAGLRAIGVTDEDRVALLSATSAEWVIADLAILTAGCATSTIYPSNTPDECAFIIGDSGSRVVVVGNGDQLEKIHAIRATIPQVLAVVIIDGAGDGDWVLSLDQLHQRGDRWLADRPTGIDEIVAGITSDRLASVIYTSGTTGRPKGVELLHDSWLYAAAAAAKLRVLTAEDVHFLWLPGTEVRIADDGEVLLRSRGVMRGYHGLPAETAAVLRDGWLHTGDIGELDHNGYLRITDRKKELIKTSGGKYIAPTVLEGQIKAASPYVSQVLVHGERRNYVTALITLDPDAIARWAAGRDLPADPVVLADTEEVRQLLQDALDDVNARLARHETIKRFAVLGAEFAVDTGELTASLKVRRRVAEERHTAVLDMLYADAIDRV
jgi:long-subunit acyl-CoA synthetase (AMP-forming)